MYIKHHTLKYVYKYYKQHKSLTQMLYNKQLMVGTIVPKTKWIYYDQSR